MLSSSELTTQKKKQGWAFCVIIDCVILKLEMFHTRSAGASTSNDVLQ